MKRQAERSRSIATAVIHIKYQPKISLIYQTVMLSLPKHLARIVKQLI